MGVVPRTLVDKLVFFESRLGPWAESAEQIGTTEEQVEALALLAAETRAAFREQQEAQAAAQAATLRFNRLLDKVATRGAGIIAQVRVHAALTDDVNVFANALLPAPAKASPVGAPGGPTRFTFTLRQGGDVELRWTCKQPRGAVGTMYHVWRQDGIGVALPWHFLGSTGKRRFVDETLPAGTAAVIYKVQAVRSTGPGGEAEYPIWFGTRGGSRLPTIQTTRAAA